MFYVQKPSFRINRTTELLASIKSLLVYIENATLSSSEMAPHIEMTKLVSGKTIEEDMSIWNRFISDSEIATM